MLAALAASGRIECWACLQAQEDICSVVPPKLHILNGSTGLLQAANGRHAQGNGLCMEGGQQLRRLGDVQPACTRHHCYGRANPGTGLLCLLVAPTSGLVLNFQTQGELPSLRIAHEEMPNRSLVLLDVTRHTRLDPIANKTLAAAWAKGCKPGG